MEFMVTEFVEACRAGFKTAGCASISNSQESGGFFLVGIGGRLFKVEEDYQVAESIDGYMAIGCGAAYALGAMYVSGAVQPKKRLRRAVSAAKRHNIGVGGPTHVLKGRK